MPSFQSRQNRPVRRATSRTTANRLRRFLFEGLENRILLAVDSSLTTEFDWSKLPSLEQLQSGKADFSSAPIFTYDYLAQDQKMVVLSDRLALDLSPSAEADLSKLSPFGLTISRPLDQSFSVYTTSQQITNDFLNSLRASGIVERTIPVFGMVATKSEAVLLNEVIVSLPETITPQSFFADPRFSGYRRLDGTPDQYVGILKNAYGVDALRIINELDQSSSAGWVAPNFYQAWQKFYIPNDSRFSNLWHLHNTGQGGGVADIDSNLPEAWDVMRGGSPTIVVGVVDDGVSTNHPDLLNWVNTGEVPGDGVDNDGNGWIDDINGWNFVTNNNVSFPDIATDRHGTRVAGVAAAIGDNNQGVAGAAYQSRVLSARIFQGNAVANDAGIASAVYYTSGRTADGTGTFAASTIANHSWGGGAPTAAITAAFQWASTQGRAGLGVPQLIASGNDFGAVSYPASLSTTQDGVICVGAISDLGVKSDYSNFGPQIDIVTGSSGGILSIDTTDHPTGYSGTAAGFTGTSAATPLATGIGALALARAEQIGVTITAANLKKMFRNNTKLVGPDPYPFPTNRNNLLGWGLLDAATLLSGIGSPKISVTAETYVVINDATYNVGHYVVGQSRNFQFRIRNQGTAPLNLQSMSVTGGDFSLHQAPPVSTLPVGESTLFTVRFSPTSEGAKLGTISIASNDSALPLIQYFLTNVSVSGHFYEDYNGDAIFNSWEPGLPNQTVILDNNGNGVIDYSNFVNNTPLSILDNATVTSTLNVAGFTGLMRDLNVTINATHTRMFDVVIALVSPTGVRSTLIENRGFFGQNLTSTVFDDAASIPISAGVAPFTGTFIPESPLAVFNGLSPNGQWRLEITDVFSGEVGTLLNWSMNITNEASTRTDEDGYYFFVGVGKGGYNVIGVTPVGHSASGPTQYPITIVSPTTSLPGRNFGVGKDYAAYVFAFLDYDRNGIRTADEPPLPNRTINAAAIGTLTTDVTYNTLTPLADNGTIDIPLIVPPGKGFVQDVNVAINLTHTWVEDLNISLISPSGVIIDLTSENGGSGDNYTNTIFDDSAAISITAGTAPFTGTFRPEQPLSIFNGTPASGQWILRVTDTLAFEVGNLISWGISIVSGLDNVLLQTDAEGWVRVDLIPATATITLVNLPGWYYTAPVSGTRTITPTGAPVYDQFFGTRPINLPPTVDPISNQFVLEDSGPLTIDISGLNAGRGETEEFRLLLSTTASPALTSPVVNHTFPSSTATITTSTVPDQTGQTVFTLLIEDAGPDNDFSTTADNSSNTVVFTVTVLPVNDPPLIDALGDLVIDEDAATQMVNLTGILAGGGESQSIRVTATSSNPSLIPTPLVNYVSASSTGTIELTPVANLSGQTVIVVTVTDAGLDNVFDTGDELSVARTFTVTVNPVNDLPTLTALPNVVMDEDAGPYTVDLTGITAGPLESQPLRVSAVSSNTSLIAHPSVSYTSPSTTGSLQFVPLPNQFGSTIISVIVEDGGLDGNLSTASDNATFTRTFTVTVNPVLDPPAFDPIADVVFDEDATNQIVTVTGISAGAGETQPLRLIAKSSLPGQVLDLAVNYTSPNPTGTIVLNGLRDQFGSLFITVIVEDGGLDNDLNTPVDNQYVQRTFNVTVRPINDAPIVTVLTNIVINEDDPMQTIHLTGIFGGPGETEPVIASLIPGDTSLLLNQTLSYTSPSTTGQITFTPVANKFGVAIMTLRLEDAGPDFLFNTSADNAVLMLPITVTVRPVNDPPSFDAISNLTINEDHPGHLVTITGITAGLDEVQPMRITATSNNIFVLQNPTVTYTSPSETGSLLLIPVANQSGSSVVTVTLEDGGVDANLATLADNTIFVRTFTVTVAAVNDLPTLNPIANVTTPEDSEAQAVVLAGISAGGNENQPLRVTATSSNAALVPNPVVNYGSPSNTGILIYTPNANEFGTAVITVQVEDGGLDQNLLTAADNGRFTQSFTISVTPVNDNPTLAPISNLSINEDSGSQSIALANITAGPGETQVLRVSVASSNTQLISPSVSYSSPANSGSISFTPAADRSGTAVLTVLVEDGGMDNDFSTTADNGSFSQVFTVTVVPENDAPTLNPIAPVAFDEDSTFIVDLQGITAGGGESQPLRVSATSSSPGILTLTVNYLSPETSGSIRLVPSSNVFGQTVVTVTVEDGGLDGDLVTVFDNRSTSQSFTVTVRPVNDLPVIGSVANQSVDEDSFLDVIVNGISAGGGETQALRVTASSGNPNLVMPVVTYTSPQSAASLRLQPAANEFGSTTIVVTVEDGGADSNLDTVSDNERVSTTFTLTVNPVNDNPVIDSLADAAFDEDGQVLINLTGIAAGPGERQNLRVTAVSSRLGVISAPIVSYTSPSSSAGLRLIAVPNSHGTSVITVQVEDGGTDNDLSTSSDNLVTLTSFTVTVNSVNDLPSIDDVPNISVNEDESADISIDGINAGPNENQPLQLTVSVNDMILMAGPIVTYTSPGSSAMVNLVPIADMYGTVIVTYRIEDGGDDADLSTTADNLAVTKTFTVTILPTNDAPSMDAVSNRLIEWNSSGVSINLTGISGGPNEQDNLRVSATSRSPSLVPNPTVNYASPSDSASLSLATVAGAFGNAIIDVMVEDGGADGNLTTTSDNLTTTVSFTVTVNAIPVANPERIRTTRNTSTTFDVLANDQDADGGVSGLRAVIAVAPPATAGTVEVLSDQTIRFIPANGFFGVTQFSYRAIDEHGSTSAETQVLVGVGKSALQNPFMPIDTNRSGTVTASDALVIIDILNRPGSKLVSNLLNQRFDVDVNGDGRITPLDALIIIDALRARRSSEGEANPLKVVQQTSAASRADAFFADYSDIELHSKRVRRG